VEVARPPFIEVCLGASMQRMAIKFENVGIAATVTTLAEELKKN
jgi:hypothetical protein